MTTLTDNSDARMTPCSSALDEAELDAGDGDTEVSDATHSDSELPPASTIQNESSEQCAFYSDVSGDEDSTMTLLTDGFDQGAPEPIVTRKELVPVCLPPVCTHCTADTN